MTLRGAHAREECEALWVELGLHALVGVGVRVRVGFRLGLGSRLELELELGFRFGFGFGSGQGSGQESGLANLAPPRGPTARAT